MDDAAPWQGRGPDDARGRARVRAEWVDARWFRVALTTVLVFTAAPTFVGVLLHSEVLIGTAFTLTRWWLCIGLVFCGAWFTVGKRLGRAIVAASALLLSVGDWTAHAVEQARPKAPAKPDDVTVMTFNVLVKGGVPELAMKTLANNPADVLALQEVSHEWEERLEAQVPARYPNRNVVSSGRGFALYSRYPLSNVSTLDDSRGKRFAQCADVSLPDKTVTVCNVHLESPAMALLSKDRVVEKLRDNARIRRREWEQLSAYLETLPKDRTRVLAGDFNTMEEDPLYRDIADDWVDAYRSLTLGAGNTWPNIGWQPGMPSVRIDYVFVKGAGLPLRARVLQEGGSDHFPVMAQLAL